MRIHHTGGNHPLMRELFLMEISHDSLMWQHRHFGHENYKVRELQWV